MGVEKAYLKGELGKGMFSDEVSFEILDYEGKSREGFFHKSTILGNFLEVSVVKEEGDKIAIVLPQRLLDDRYQIIVNRKSLIYGRLN